MITAEPINDQNAIERVSFVVAFNRQLTHEELEKRVMPFQELFKDSLPIANQLHTVSLSVSMSSEMPEKSTSASASTLGGLSLQAKTADDLKLDGN